MNNIFMQNMDSILNKTKKKVSSRSVVRLNPNGTVAQIIDYLHDNGPASASDLNTILRLPASAGNLLVPSMKRNMVLRSKPAEVARGFLYELAPNMTLASFGLAKRDGKLIAS